MSEKSKLIKDYDFSKDYFQNGRYISASTL